jgi:hypothetical protein
MRKLFLTILAVCTLGAVQAQGNFEVGASVGIPIADAADISDFMIGIDAYYMFKQEDAFINLGPTVGFRNFFVDFGDLDNGMFLPVGAAGRLPLFGTLRGGADVGYAIGLSDYLDGGFYFRPIIGVDLLDTLELNASWENIWDEATWGSIQVGAKLEF